MLENLKEQVRLLKQRGKVQTGHKQQEVLSQSEDPKTTEVNYVNCFEGYAPFSSFKESPYDSSLLQVIIDKNKHLGTAKCIKIMGIFTYFAHKWQDKVSLNLTRIPNTKIIVPASKSY